MQATVLESLTKLLLSYAADPTIVSKVDGMTGASRSRTGHRGQLCDDRRR